MADTVIATELARIEAAKVVLKNKGVELGISLTTDKLDAIATKFNTNLVDRGGISATVREGESVTIAKGYHDGTGTVAGIAGGGDYGLQSKTVTPTKSQQAITSDDGYYGLDAVTVKPIPDAYQDVSGTTVSAEDVLVTKVFTKADGTVATGSMPNIGSFDNQLSVNQDIVSIPEGYHNGAGEIVAMVTAMDAIPTEEEQVIESEAGEFLAQVTVAPIPEKYKDTTGANSLAPDVLSGKKFVNSTGVVTGSMPNNGSVTGTIDGLSATSYTVPAGYTSGGTVSLTDDIETRLAAI